MFGTGELRDIGGGSQKHSNWVPDNAKVISPGRFVFVKLQVNRNPLETKLQLKIVKDGYLETSFNLSWEQIKLMVLHPGKVICYKSGIGKYYRLVPDGNTWQYNRWGDNGNYSTSLTQDEHELVLGWAGQVPVKTSHSKKNIEIIDFEECCKGCGGYYNCLCNWDEDEESEKGLFEVHPEPKTLFDEHYITGLEEYLVKADNHLWVVEYLSPSYAKSKYMPLLITNYWDTRYNGYLMIRYASVKAIENELKQGVCTGNVQEAHEIQWAKLEKGIDFSIEGENGSVLIPWEIWNEIIKGINEYNPT
jgi:hypothetical protein